MRIARVFQPGAPYAAPDETLRDAALRMRSHALSVLPVLAGGALVGILTEHDLVDAAANGVRPAVGRVGDYMNDGPVTVGLEDDVSVAAAKMLAIGCRHLPVTDRGRLVGMVSARDVFLATAHVRAEGVLVS